MPNAYSGESVDIYDLLVGGDEAAQKVAQKYLPYVRNKRVIDIGTGTGDVLRRWSNYAESVVAMDNSPDMLNEASKHALPHHVSLREADFLTSLRVHGSFDLALASRGSLMCVTSISEFTSAIKNVREVLRPGGVLIFEAYSFGVYTSLLQESEIPFNHNHLTGRMVLRRDRDILHVTTHVDESPAGSLDVTETVLFLEANHIINAVEAQGFSLDPIETTFSRGESAFDTYNFVVA